MVKRIVVLAVILAGAIPGVASAAFLRVAPTTVPAGDVVHVTGSVAGVGCGRGDGVTIFSRAFSHVHDFAGLPAISARVGANGRFSVNAVIPITRAAGVYSVGARCGGAPFGHASVRVNRSAFVDVSPTTVPRGGGLRVFGSTRTGCAGGTVTLISRAFRSSREFAGVPALYARVVANGAFSLRTVIPADRSPGLYSVGARCSGGNVGSVQVRVR